MPYQKMVNAFMTSAYAIYCSLNMWVSSLPLNLTRVVTFLVRLASWLSAKAVVNCPTSSSIFCASALTPRTM